MMDDMRDDAVNPAVERAANLLREPVPVRREWRDELLARVDADARPARQNIWAVRPPVAIAAGIALLVAGAVLGRVSRVDGPAAAAVTAAAPAPTGVRFVYVAPAASKVSVVGDFNQWNPDAVPLRRLGDGTWIADVPLLPGRYAYAFVVDGRIVADPAAPRADDGDFGSNSVLMIRGS